MSNGVYPRNASLVQHSKINQYNLPCQQIKGEKTGDYFNRWGKEAFDKIQHLFMGKKKNF